MSARPKCSRSAGRQAEHRLGLGAGWVYGTHPVATCANCGTRYTQETWNALRYIGTQHTDADDEGPAEDLELRNCTCGSTLAVKVDKGANSKLAGQDGPMARSQKCARQSRLGAGRIPQETAPRGQTAVVVLPAFLASALINGDVSGIEEEDLHWVEAAENYVRPGHFVDVGEPFYSGWNELPGFTQSADVAEYTVLYAPNYTRGHHEFPIELKGQEWQGLGVGSWSKYNESSLPAEEGPFLKVMVESLHPLYTTWSRLMTAPSFQTRLYSQDYRAMLARAPIEMTELGLAQAKVAGDAFLEMGGMSGLGNLGVAASTRGPNDFEAGEYRGFKLYTLASYNTPYYYADGPYPLGSSRHFQRIKQLTNYIDRAIKAGKVQARDGAVGHVEEHEEPSYEMDEDPEEPEEDDWTTTDHQHFYSSGRLVLDVGPDAWTGSMWQKIDAAMKKANFFPNVWFISDHGNAHLMSRTD